MKENIRRRHLPPERKRQDGRGGAYYVNEGPVPDEIANQVQHQAASSKGCMDEHAHPDPFARTHQLHACTHMHTRTCARARTPVSYTHLMLPTS